MIGQTISHFRIISRIGAGGMGEVWLAEDIKLGRKLALKFLPAQFTADADRVRRFEQEARAASALNHPNIITIYEIGHVPLAAGETHFIATEFIEGETLRQKLGRGRLDLPAALDIAVQAMGALQAAHAAGIAHRDIKPENIMMRPDGYLKILDFGLAKLTEQTMETGDQEGPTRSLFETQPGLVMGTLAYMSPEQARAQRIDGRTDIFSFGVVLYEMIGGQRPFLGATTSDVIAALLVSEPARLSQQLPALPGELDQIVTRMLVKDREARYQTAAEVLADLKRVKARVDLGEDEETKQLTHPAAPGPAVAAAAASSGQAQMSFETNAGPINAAVQAASPASSIGLPTNMFPAQTVAPAAGITIPARKFSLRAGGAALAVLLVALAVGGYFLTQRGRVESIAVLPFVNQTNDPTLAYVTDGLTEELINTLSDVPELSIVSRNAVMRYRDKEPNASDVGRELDVQAVLIGRVQRNGDYLTVNTELVDAGNGRRLWGRQINRKLRELVAVQDDIVRGIAGKLDLTLSKEMDERLANGNTANGDAYEKYLQARWYYNRGSRADLKKADELFEAAVGLDPQFAEAAAGCAACHAGGSDGKPPAEVMPTAKQVALIALKADEKQVDAHLTLARVNLRYDWDFATAERGFKRALELEPKNPVPHQRYAEFLALMGRHAEAKTEIWKARALDPRSFVINSDLGLLSYYAQDYEHAVEHFNLALKGEENFPPAQAGLGLVFEQQGQAQEAVFRLLRAKQLIGEPPDYVGSLKQAFAANGIKSFWQRELEHLQAEAKNHYIPASAFAALHARLGDKEKAFAELERGLAEKDGGLVELKVLPIFAGLQADARFANLLKRVGLAQ